MRVDLELFGDRAFDPAHVDPDDDHEKFKGEQKVDRLQYGEDLVVGASVEVVDVENDAVGNMEIVGGSIGSAFLMPERRLLRL